MLKQIDCRYNCLEVQGGGSKPIPFRPYVQESKEEK